jgi:hypothetical protein
MPLRFRSTYRISTAFFRPALPSPQSPFDFRRSSEYLPDRRSCGHPERFFRTSYIINPFTDPVLPAGSERRGICRRSRYHPHAQGLVSVREAEAPRGFPAGADIPAPVGIPARTRPDPRYVRDILPPAARSGHPDHPGNPSAAIRAAWFAGNRSIWKYPCRKKLIPTSYDLTQPGEFDMGMFLHIFHKFFI